MPASRCEVMPARGTSGSGEYSVCLSLSRQRAVRNPERPRCSSNTPPTSLRLSCFIAARAACRSSDESRWADLSPVSGPTSKYDYLDFGRPSVHAVVGWSTAIGRSSRTSRWFFSPAAPVNRCVRRDDDGGHARISKWLVHGRSTTALRLSGDILGLVPGLHIAGRQSWIAPSTTISPSPPAGYLFSNVSANYSITSAQAQGPQPRSRRRRSTVSGVDFACL